MLDEVDDGVLARSLSTAMVWRRRESKPAPVAPGEERIRVLETSRLVLLAANRAVLEADLKGPENLSSVVRAEVGAGWPPELYDRSSLEYALRQMDGSSSHGWSLWYLMTQDSTNPTVIGICGFKGRPDSRGSVEISYSILEAYRNRGFASEAVSRLVAWAFSHQHVHEVSAEVLAHRRQSMGVLEKCGFRPAGAGSERGVVRYVVQRPDRR